MNVIWMWCVVLREMCIAVWVLGAQVSSIDFFRMLRKLARALPSFWASKGISKSVCNVKHFVVLLGFCPKFLRSLTFFTYIKG